MENQRITDTARGEMLDALCERRNELEMWLCRLPHAPTQKELELFETEMAEVRRRWSKYYERNSSQNT